MAKELRQVLPESRLGEQLPGCPKIPLEPVVTDTVVSFVIVFITFVSIKNLLYYQVYVSSVICSTPLSYEGGETKAPNGITGLPPSSTGSRCSRDITSVRGDSYFFSSLIIILC